MAAGSPGPVVPPRDAAALGGDDPVSVMAETPDRVRRLIRGLTEKHLETKPARGKWCIKEIVAHLADGEVILGSRYRFIGAHDRPPLPGYDQDAFVERLGPMNAKAADLADDFAMARAVNLGLLERLPAAAWERVGLHAARGGGWRRRGGSRGTRAPRGPCPPRPGPGSPCGRSGGGSRSGPPWRRTRATIA